MIEVIVPEVLIAGAILEHVIDSGEDGSGDGANGLFGAASGTDAVELGLDVAALLARRSPAALDQGGLKPRSTLSHAGRAPLTGTLVVLGAQTGPGDEMRRGGKSAHVVADLGRDDACTKLTDPRNGGQQLDGGAKGLDALVHFAIDLGNSGVDGIDLLKVQPQQKAVVLHDPAAQRSLLRRARQH